MEQDVSRQRIFRQSALDRLASPEQLDVLQGVTARKLWLVLTAVVAPAVAAALWWFVDLAVRAG